MVETLRQGCPNHYPSFSSGFGLDTFTEEEIDEICNNFDNQHQQLRQEVENFFPELKNPRKTAEEIDEAYKKAYENVALCLKERKLVIDIG